MSRTDIARDADRTLAVEMAYRLKDRLLALRDDERHGDELTSLCPHLDERQVLRARALRGQQAHPDVDPAPLGRELADRVAADERADGAPDLGHRHPEL